MRDFIFCQCDFTQLWGNQPTKIGRKALRIRIKINKIQKAIHTVSQTSNPKSTCFVFPKLKKVKKRKKVKRKKPQQTHPKTTK